MRRLRMQTEPYRFTKRFDKMPRCVCLVSADLGLVFIFPEKKKAGRLDVGIAEVTSTSS